MINYLPFTAGIDFAENDQGGNTSFSLGATANFSGNDAGFAATAYSPRARATFGKFNLSVVREQKAYREWSLL